MTMSQHGAVDAPTYAPCIDETVLRALPWSSLIRFTNQELNERGVPWRKASALRTHVTGHSRSMRGSWWMSIGMWGRIHTADDIAYVLDESVVAVRAHARGCGLRVAPPRARVPQSGLAALLYQKADDSGIARHFGLLEVERRRYVLAVEAMVGGLGFDFARVTQEAWRTAWARQPLVMPEDLPVDVAHRRRTLAATVAGWNGETVRTGPDGV